MYQILKGGCHSYQPENFLMNRPQGINVYVLLLVRVPTHFQISSQKYFLRANQAVVIAPNTPYSYYTPSGPYIDDFLHFQLSDSTIWPDDLVPLNTPFPLADIEILSIYIQQLVWEAHYTDSHIREDNLTCLFKILLNHLGSTYQMSKDAERYTPYQRKLQEIHLQLLNNMVTPPSIEECCKHLHISKSHFSHMYKQIMGVSFQQDLIRIRISYAKHLLRTSDLPIEKVLELCGYTTEVHFYRQFKKETGITPTNYRKKAN